MKTIRHSKVILLSAFLVATLFTTNLSAAGNTASASPNQINFGKQTIGAIGAPVNVVVSNPTRAQITIRGVSVSAGQFKYSGPSLPITISPGRSFTGSVSFTPTGTNTYRGTLAFSSSNGFPILVALSGSGITGQALMPSITTQPASQTIASGNTATFSVAASGTAPMTYQWRLNGSAISGAISATYTTPAETASSSGAQFSVVVSNAGGNATSSAALLTVNAAAPGALNSSTSSLSFGTVNVSSSKSMSVTLTNSGKSSVSITNVTLTGAGFDPSGVSSGLIIPAGSAATLNVAFAPAASGAVSGAITISSTASDPSLVINLSGSGVQNALLVNLSWTASASSSVAGYNVFRSTVSGASYIQLNSSLVTGTQYTDSTAVGNQVYYYVVTAVNSSDAQSADSNQAAATP